MSVFDLFSKRQKTQRGELPDVYTYDSIPHPLKVQIVQMMFAALGNQMDAYRKHESQEAYTFIVDQLCREYGVFRLPPQTNSIGNDYRDYVMELGNFILQEKDAEKVLDAVELVFRVVDSASREYEYLNRQNANRIADQTIEELNTRFKEHGIGFQFENDEIVRVDSAFLHSEAVRPALRLLTGKGFAGAQQEFLNAHEHYRHGKAKEALNECLKAFESVMKAICAKRNWAVSPNATAKDLIQVCLANGLIPAFWQTSVQGLRSLLESSIPTGRNKLGGHGQGAAPVSVPDHLVAYMLHMTASVVVFLVEADKQLG